MEELEPITTEQTEDITFSHILPRLPAKSLCRFACVSKQWYSFLRTPEIRKKNLHLVINDDNQNHLKLLFIPNAQPWVFRTMDCESPKYGLSASRHFPFEIRPRQKMSIVTSLHGMVCVALTMPGSCYDYSDLILWNPVTGNYKKLSTADYPCESFQDKFGLYYSSSEDDYKLVYALGHPNAYIYSLKSDSWTAVDPSVFLNENPSFLYYLIKLEELLTSKSNSTMTFDTKTKKFRDIPTPPSENQRTDSIGYMVVNGSIYFCVAIINSFGQYDTIELWGIISGYGYWDKVVTSSLKERFRGYRGSYKLLHLMKNGNWLMHSRRDDYVCVLDTKNNTKDNICSFSIAFSPEGKYLETIMSPNQYME